MVPKVSEQHVAERRQQIVDAAVVVFADKGFHQATLDDVRQEAGLSKGAVYHYFKSKNAIVEALLDQWRQLDASLFAQVRVLPSSTARLQALVDAAVARVSRRGADAGNRLGLLLWAEALLSPSLMTALNRLTDVGMRGCSAIVREGQAAGEIDPRLDTEEVARVFLGAILGLYTYKAWSPDLDLGPAAKALNVMIMGLRPTHVSA